MVILWYRFDKGVAEALQTLCSIFISKSKTEFLSVYLAQFYRGLEEVNRYPEMPHSYLFPLVTIKKQLFNGNCVDLQ